MKRMNFPSRKEERRLGAAKRQDERATRSTEQQLKLIASRRGESKREVEKLSQG